MDLSVVIPCFNEQEALLTTYQRVKATCESLGVGEYELIFVNDGSIDQTWSLILKISKYDRCVVGVDLARNFGHQIALSAGLSVSKGDRVFVLDADLQDPPELLNEMMDTMDEGYDVVYGKRVTRRGESFFKKMSAFAFYRILSYFSNVTIPVDTGDFRLMSRRVVDGLKGMPEQYRFIRGLVAWQGYKQCGIDYERHPRVAGTSKYPFFKMIAFAFDAISGFSIAPVRLASFMALVFSLLSLILSVHAVASWLFLNAVPGWSSTALAISALGAIQLVCIGVIGEYVGRIYMEVKARPLFLINDIVSHKVIESDEK